MFQSHKMSHVVRLLLNRWLKSQPLRCITRAELDVAVSSEVDVIATVLQPGSAHHCAIRHRPGYFLRLFRHDGMVLARTERVETLS